MLPHPMSKDIAILYEQQKSIIVLQILEPNRIARDYGIKNLIIELKVDEWSAFIRAYMLDSLQRTRGTIF